MGIFEVGKTNSIDLKPGGDLARDSRIYGVLPGELLAVEPKTPGKWSHAKPRSAVFLSRLTANMIERANIPAWQLDVLIRMIAYEKMLLKPAT